MKPRGIDLAIGRPRYSFFAALKVFLLTALVVLFLNAIFSLYTNVSKRYYTNPHPPFLRITSSSSISSNYSATFSFSSTPPSSPSYSSSSSYPYSNSPPPPSTPSSWEESSMESESISSFPFESPLSPILNPPSSTSADSLPYSSSNSTPSPPSLSFSEPPPPPPSSSASSSYSSSAQSTTPLAIDQSPSTVSPHPPFLISSSAPIPSLEKPSSRYYNLSLSSSSSSSSSFSSPHLIKSNSRPYQERGKRKGLLKGCDVSKGEWVPDPKAPYYTNSTCWTIQEHQNCLKYGRPNLDFLKWRWKPDGCELPHLDPSEFLEFMRGKNLAFIGDSLARNQIQSLMCLLSRVEYPREIWPSSADNVTQMFYQNYNFTIWTFWSPFLVNAKEFIASNNYGMWSLYLDEPDPLWQPHLSKFDHIILNTGNWFTRPANFFEKKKLIGCHYCVAKKVPFMSVYKAHRKAFRTALDAIVENKQGFKGVTVVRTVSPSHFEGGESNKGVDCKRATPLGRGGAKLKGMDLELYKDQLKEFWKAKWEGNEKGLEFRLLDTTQAMLLRPDGHPSRYGHWPHEKRVLYNDCVHWCLPGPVDMWNDLLFQILII